MYNVKNFEQAQTSRFIYYSGTVTKDGKDVGYFEDKGDGGAFTVSSALEQEIKNSLNKPDANEFDYAQWVNALLEKLGL